MEGSTYNPIEKAGLIHFGQEVSGTDARQTVVILNHKEVTQYVVERLAGNFVRSAGRHCGLETTELCQEEIESVAAESE